MSVEIVPEDQPDAPPLVPTVSYSALSNWLSCGYSFYLARVKKVPRRPGWWFPGGTAVHAATECYDRLLFESEGK